MSEETTTSSSRIFVKILFQELCAYMGLPRLNQRLKDMYEAQTHKHTLLNVTGSSSSDFLFMTFNSELVTPLHLRVKP